METSFKMKLAATTTAVALVCVGATYAYFKRKIRLSEAAEALNYMKINIVTTEKCCDTVVTKLQERLNVHKAVGFDCEWVTEHGKRRPVALLQLATDDGYCGLFRLCHLNGVPHSLKALLEDETIYKVGVAACDDAKYMFNDYGVALKSTLDIRHIAELCGRETGGLAALSKDLLGIVLDKSWRIRCCDWEADNLSQRQTMYAAADAHVAIRIFVKLLEEYHRKGWRMMFMSEDRIWLDLDKLCWNYLDVHFRTKKRHGADINVNPNKTTKSKEPTLGSRYKHATRTKPLYDNCVLEAPDGEMLCTCDTRKAQWYIEKQLADIVCEDPLTVRLRFEPSGRNVGDVGRYYTMVKHNRCVVCGADNSYIRKNVVPREYRKHFPDILKDHSSHDVVLLCAPCHQRSNMRDQSVRERLAVQCDAPVGDSGHGPYAEDIELKKVRSAARALQSVKHTLPPQRRTELEAVLLAHYQCVEITDEILQKAAHLDVQFENAEYESHGQKVVEYYLSNSGLLQLERLWREHFLSAMRPRHMPELWSVTHTEDRLRIKMKEGRLSEKDIKLIKLD